MMKPGSESQHWGGARGELKLPKGKHIVICQAKPRDKFHPRPNTTPARLPSSLSTPQHTPAHASVPPQRAQKLASTPQQSPTRTPPGKFPRHAPHPPAPERGRPVSSLLEGGELGGIWEFGGNSKQTGPCLGRESAHLQFHQSHQVPSGPSDPSTVRSLQ